MPPDNLDMADKENTEDTKQPTSELEENSISRESEVPDEKTLFARHETPIVKM